jgi:hypothetical protein
VFQKITLQQQKVTDSANPLDLGFLAEAMLFYETVEVLANRVSLTQLVRQIGPELLLEFLKCNHLRLRFEKNFTGVYTENSGTAAEQHALTVFEISGQDLLDVLRPAAVEAVRMEGKGRRLALKLADQIQDTPIDSRLADRTAADLFQKNYVHASVLTILRQYIPAEALPAHLRFEIIPVEEKKFRVDTNLDLNRLNDLYHRVVPISHSSLSPAYILPNLDGEENVRRRSARGK